MNTTVTPIVVGNTLTPETTRVVEPQALQPTVRLVVEAQAVDARSAQFQCAVRIENTGAHPLQIVSLRSLAPLGTVVQQVIDTSQSEVRVTRDKIYRDLEILLSSHLIHTSSDYRKTVVEKLVDTLKELYSAKGVAKVYYSLVTRQARSMMRSMTENIRAWEIDIRNSTRAQHYYDEFLKSHEQDSDVLCSIYRAKLEDVRQLESELGDSGQDASVADVLPGGNFSRTYIYNCERRLLNPKTYTFSFDCGYIDHVAPDEQKHLAGSITAGISPKPLVLNILAIISAILGAVLKIALDTSQAKDSGTQAALTAQLGTLVTMSACEAIVAAMITALFFYNVYDSTDVGRASMLVLAGGVP